MPAAHFVTDSATENWLTHRGVKFTYRQHIPYAELNPGWQVVNQGRPDGQSKDDDTILKYAAAQADGNAFPAPLIAKAADGWEVLDGIQRLSAGELNDQKVFNAYVIETDNPSVRTSIRVCANCRNGQSASQEWTITRIVEVMYDTFRLSATDCAAWSGMPLKRIENEISSREASIWLEGAGINVKQAPARNKGFLAMFAEIFPPGESRERIRKQIPEIIKRLQAMNASNTEAEELLRAATEFKPRQGKDLGQQVLDRFEEVMERPEVKARVGGGRVRRSPIDNAKAILASAVTALRKASEGHHEADADQSKEFVRLMEEAKSYARSIVPKERWGSLAFGPRRE